MGADVLDRFDATGDLLDFNVHVADQEQLEPFPHDRVVIGDERFDHGVASGIEQTIANDDGPASKLSSPAVGIALATTQRSTELPMTMERDYPSYRLSPAARRLRLLRSRPDAPASSHSPQQQLGVIADVLQSAGIAVVFDIHPGSCAVGVQLRRAGFTGRIITFEPNPAAWEQLRYCSMTDEQWYISRSAIRLHEEIIFAPGEIPIIGTSLAASLEVFCDEEEPVAVWLTQPQECLLFEAIAPCTAVRVVSIASTISDADDRTCSIEQTLGKLREQRWEVLAVHSRTGEQNGGLTIADVIAVRVP